MPKVEGMGSVNEIVTYSWRRGRPGVVILRFRETEDLRRDLAGRREGVGIGVEVAELGEDSMSADFISSRRLFSPSDEFFCDVSDG